MRLLLPLIVVLGLLASPTHAQSEKDGWLVGRWELTHDPEGNPKDWLEFSAKGKVTSIAPDGRRTLGDYVVAEGEIRMTLLVGEMRIPITLKIAPDRKRLFTYSAKTKTSATYEKVR
jgi:hypothetical protein